MALFNRKRNIVKDIDTEKDVKVKGEKQIKDGTKTVNKKTKKVGEKKKVNIIRGSRILFGPVVTEKTAQLTEKGVIVFKVLTKANRVEVRNEFKAVYGVTPIKINIINSRGKKVRFGKTEGKRIDTKKAIITLPAGKTIDIFEGV